ncbi:MAG: hypothetical protein ACRC0V_07065 [Fusobacteriaceae bacterium]|uniref:hypothetical protein n=1 Tax=Cetobacterium sp. TaxID=2071632 RepID=UPI003F32EAA4
MHRNLSYETAFLGAIGAIEKKYPVTGLIAEDGLKRDRTTDEGRGHHLDEIKETQGGFYTPENKSIIQSKMKSI